MQHFYFDDGYLVVKSVFGTIVKLDISESIAYMKYCQHILAGLFLLMKNGYVFMTKTLPIMFYADSNPVVLINGITREFRLSVRSKTKSLLANMC